MLYGLFRRAACLHRRREAAEYLPCPGETADSYNLSMAPLGALSQAWVSAEASLPHGWESAGVWRSGEAWSALSEGPDRDYLDASGRFPDQALRRLADALRERRGPVTG